MTKPRVELLESIPNWIWGTCFFDITKAQHNTTNNIKIVTSKSKVSRKRCTHDDDDDNDSDCSRNSNRDDKTSHNEHKRRCVTNSTTTTTTNAISGRRIPKELHDHNQAPKTGKKIQR